MSNKPDTKAALEREREDVDERIMIEKSKSAGEGYANGYADGYVAGYADGVDKGGTVNAAAMREALEKCRALAETIWQSEGGEDVSAEIAELKDRISAALSALPKNCDVPHKDGHELWLRWQAYCAEIYPSTVSFSTWLLAPAKEGDNNGSK